MVGMTHNTKAVQVRTMAQMTEQMNTERGCHKDRGGGDHTHIKQTSYCASQGREQHYYSLCFQM